MDLFYLIGLWVQYKAHIFSTLNIYNIGLIHLNTIQPDKQMVSSPLDNPNVLASSMLVQFVKGWSVEVGFT